MMTSRAAQGQWSASHRETSTAGRESFARVHTHHAEDNGKDEIEEAIGVVAKRAHAPGFLGCDQGIGTARVLPKGRRCGIHVSTAIELFGNQSPGTSPQMSRAWRDVLGAEEDFASGQTLEPTQNADWSAS